MGGLTITGYVLEPVRVGAANSPYTWTPNIYISDQSAFDSAYPSNESAPRTDYFVFVLTDGNFPTVTLCWSKNEVINRFDYDGLRQHFRNLPGASREDLGILGLDSNVNRLTVTAIPAETDLVSYPIRVGLAAVTTFTVSLVLNDSAFGTPSTGTVELSLDTGNLNWAAADLTTYNGSGIYFQRQSFFDWSDSSGNLGVIEEDLYLNPLPATGQFPLVRIGYRQYLTPSEVAVLGSPVAGTVEWQVTTGLLRFSVADKATYAGASIYYDGVVFGFDESVQQGLAGTVSTPGTVPITIPEESDLFFQVTGAWGTKQFAQTSWVDTLSTNGKAGVVEVLRSSGQVRFSLADRSSYGTGTVTYVVPDLDIERGMTLRMFRTPVDPEGLSTNPDADARAFYVAENATLASPMIGSPSVFLPAIPQEDAIFTVDVLQGTGTFTGTLPDLSGSSPTPGYGYLLDLDENQLRYARYRENLVLDQPVGYGVTQLPDPLVFTPNLILELEDTPGGGVYSPLTLGNDVLFDYTTGLLTFVETCGTLVTTGSTGTFNGNDLTDLSIDFLSYPVLQGDLLIVTSGAAAGLYVIETVTSNVLTVDVSGGVESNLSYEIRRGYEILADRFFQEVSPVDPNTRVERVAELGVANNTVRLSIDLDFIDDFRFWFDRTTISTSVTKVTNDGAFSSPASLGEFEVEISEATGNLNFSQTAVTGGYLVLSMRVLTLGTDYQLQAALGFIEFTDRMLENEEMFLTYAVIDENDDKQIVEERAVFLVRKELTADHSTPTSTLSFNPLGRTVASTPAPEAFRGGRPQVTGEQVAFDTSASTITFLADDQVTNALPHGAVVGPTENVYIDYYVYGAIGGEKSVTVLQPPMVSIPVSIEEGKSTFTIGGDRTSVFQANHLLKVDRSEVYLIDSSTYDAGTELTTVTLASLQTFRSDLTDPRLDVSSGATRATGVVFFPAYFIPDTNTWDTSPRGASSLYFVGDVSREYITGTILLFTDGSTFLDLTEVTGSTYDESRNRTEVVLLANNPRQYDGTVTLKRSVRPILSDTVSSATTSEVPVLDAGYTAFRRTEGSAGLILSEPGDFTIDGAGQVIFVDPLQANEELGLLYTKTTIIGAGRRIRASYTHAVVPTDNNGLEGQVLQAAEYTTYLPDSFYWRVETFTNFRGELAEQYEEDAQASIPSGGPRLENSSQLQLYEQGRESIWFEENRLANEDLVARPTLKYYNDAINFLEDAIQMMDGRVVGGHDGRFLFDGLINNPHRTVWTDVTNQIDDLFKISAAPGVLSFPPLSISFTDPAAGTYTEVYKANDFSRFYPTKRSLFGVTVDPTGLETGDTILDTGRTNLRAVNQVSRRLPWAVVVEEAVAGSTTLQVDGTGQQEDLMRPSFDPNDYSPVPTMPVVIRDRDGTWLLPTTGPGIAPTLDVLSVTATSITLTGSLPVDVPVGATIYHIPFYSSFTPAPATPYLKNYRVGFDVGVNLEEGVLTHIVPFPPYDGTDPLVPAPLNIQNPGAGEILDVFAQTNVGYTSPDRFPALDGGTTDDDNNRTLPMLTPSPVQEIDYLGKESGTLGSIVSVTTDGFSGTGDLDVARTTITNLGGAWPAPVPKPYDLVEIRSGANAFSGYYRILTVGVSTITVATAFPVVDTGFSFVVTVSTSLVTGTGVVSPLTTLTDGAANFIAAGVEPGHTVVFTSGAGVIGERRQVTAVVSPTQLNIEAPSLTGTFSYAVDDSVLTFGGTNSILNNNLIPALEGQIGVLDTYQPPTYVWSESEAVERFLDLVMTDITTGVNGETSIGSPTLTDTTKDFTQYNITSSSFVWIATGTSAGAYQIDQVTSPTTLDIQGTFPATTASISYRIVETLGAGILTLTYLHRIYTEVNDAILDVQTFLTLVSNPVSVGLDSGAFGRRTLFSDVTARQAAITIRQNQLTNSDPSVGSIVALETALASGDKWFDKRYTWIDARINLETGILTKKDRAVLNRLKNQSEILNQLIKLLTV